jgi:uncharacterized protein YecT (DUF1311 family)
MGQGQDLLEHMGHTEAALRRKFKALMALVAPAADERLQKALVAQEAAWLTYRREECELTGSLTGAQGSWPSTYAIRCESNLTDQRLRRVISATRCVARLPEGDRFVYMSDCLQQLAPLANAK